MADTRYLKKRRQGWYFVIKIPVDLQQQVGRREKVVTLDTRDLTEAQTRRWPLVAEWTARFEVMRGTRQMTPTEIEAVARSEFQSYLGRLAETDATDEHCRIAASMEAERAEHGNLTDLDYAVAVARVHAANGRRAALAGNAYTVPDSFGRKGIDPLSLKPVGARKSKLSLPFKDNAEKYIEEFQRNAASKRKEQTSKQYEAVYRLFDSWAGQPDMSEIDEAKAASFLDAVARLDPDWGRSPDTKKRTFSELIEKYGDHPKGLSNRTINRYATALHLLWKWVKKKAPGIGPSPWAELQRPKGAKRATEKYPFTSDELKLLLAVSPEAKPKAHTYESTMPWLCLISAYSGLRLNEICSLRRDELKQEDGIWYFDVQRAKTEAGDRRVPIHSRLIKAGILTFKDSHKDEWLFPRLIPGGPDAKRSWYPSKRFTVLRRSLGIVRIDVTTGVDRVDFHSFRRSAVAALEKARVPQTEAAQVVGHERGGITYGTYNRLGLDLPALRDVVETIRYEGIDLPKQRAKAA